MSDGVGSVIDATIIIGLSFGGAGAASPCFFWFTVQIQPQSMQIDMHIL